MGGLGNQMFQYAAAYALSKRNNSSLQLDLSFVKEMRNEKNFTNRDFELKVLNANIISVNPLVLKIVKTCNRLFERLKLKSRVIKAYHEKGLAFEKSFLTLTGNYYLIGYFQSEKYFLAYRVDMLKAFSFKYPLVGENLYLSQLITSHNSIAVHVRRGDYVSKKEVNDFHGVLAMDYFSTAMEFIRQKVQAPFFYFFSDDPEWVKENLGSSSESLVINHNHGFESYRDLQLMSLCKHNIIANSSFSWWAAWLNQNPDKMVIAPQNWFKDKTIDTSNLIPKTWITL